MVVETHERYGPGGPQGELDDFARYARQIVRTQERNRRKQGAARAERALHAKSGLGVDNAEFIVRDDLPAVLRQGCFQPGARLRATVRLSNGSGMRQPDGVKDLRGIAVRLFGAGHVHDLLMTNFERPHAANAAEFMAVAMALAGHSSPAAKLISLVVRLPPRVGVFAAARIIVNVLKSGRRVGSLATETYWSRGAILWGGAGPVRYLLRPLQTDAPSPADGDDALRIELSARLRRGPVEFELVVQRYVSDTATPVENVSTPWRVEREWPIGRLRIPQQDLDTAEARLIERRVELLAFNPWNTPNEFRPLGNLNRARRFVYEASAAHRNGQLFEVDQRPIQRACDAAAASVFGFLNRTVRIPWYRMPTRLGLLNLAMLRRRLRKHNLIDTTPRLKRVEVREPTPQPSAAQLLERDPSGRYNDLSSPEMGAIGAPFGRNMRIDREQGDTPDPRDVSRVLLARDRFIPARSLNMLAAAWIQFQVHDWAKHEKYLLRERSIDLPARPDLGEGVMRIAADRGDGNEVTHWWDGSEVYGTPGATD